MAEESFTEGELVRLRELFDHLDADHDGFINHFDLQRFLRDEFGHDIAKERAAELIAKADPEGLGRVGFEQFHVALEAHLIKLRIAIRLISAFKRFGGGNKSVLIRRHDLIHYVQREIPEFPEERVDELLQECNIGEDGLIRFEEFKVALIKRLRQLE